MAKILEFRLPIPKPLTPEEIRAQELTPTEAIDLIVTAMVCHLIPMWVENRWPFKAVEILAEELRAAMSQNPPASVSRWQVDAMIEELKPAWTQIAKEAILFL